MGDGEGDDAARERPAGGERGAGTVEQHDGAPLQHPRHRLALGHPDPHAVRPGAADRHRRDRRERPHPRCDRGGVEPGQRGPVRDRGGVEDLLRGEPPLPRHRHLPDGQQRRRGHQPDQHRDRREHRQRERDPTHHPGTTGAPLLPGPGGEPGAGRHDRGPGLARCGRTRRRTSARPRPSPGTGRPARRPSPGTGRPGHRPSPGTARPRPSPGTGRPGHRPDPVTERRH